MAKKKKVKRTAGAKNVSLFKEHPVISMTIFWVVNLVLLELVLRWINPSIIEFAHEARRVHVYSPELKTDLAPDAIAHMKLTAPDGQFLYNFTITTGPYGFRTYDRQIDHQLLPKGEAPEDQRTIHAVGDSFTMGWGVDYSSSYPAILEWLLDDNIRVLNLGMDGFGVMAATEKSMALWERFPAEHAIYLFTPNDFEDDERMVRFQQRGTWYHFAYQFYDILRRDTYLCNLMTGIRWYAFFDEARKDTSVVARKQEWVGMATPDNLQLDVDTLRVQIPDLLHPSLRQIKKYDDFVKERGAKLHVFVYSGDEVSLYFYKYCIQNGIDVQMFDLPDEMKLIRDGHFNRAGSHAFALLVKDRIAQQP